MNRLYRCKSCSTVVADGQPPLECPSCEDEDGKEYSKSVFEVVSITELLKQEK